MKPQGHLVASAALGGICWAGSRNPGALLTSLAFGVLLDLDHLIDYWYAERRLPRDLDDFRSGRYFVRSGRLFVLFHGYEYLPLLYLGWRALRGRQAALVAVGAVLLHLLADQLVNYLKPLGYFVSYRVAHRFRTAEIIDWDKRERLRPVRLERAQRVREGAASGCDRVLGVFA